MDLFKIQSKLIICGTDIDNLTGQISVVSAQPKECVLPSYSWRIGEDNISDTYNKLSLVTGLHKTWVKAKLTETQTSVMDANFVSLIFLSWIPLDTELKSYFWIPVDAVADKQLRTLIIRTMQKL